MKLQSNRFFFIEDRIRPKLNTCMNCSTQTLLNPWLLLYNLSEMSEWVHERWVDEHMSDEWMSAWAMSEWAHERWVNERMSDEWMSAWAMSEWAHGRWGNERIPSPAKMVLQTYLFSQRFSIEKVLNSSLWDLKEHCHKIFYLDSNWNPYEQTKAVSQTYAFSQRYSITKLENNVS